MAARDNAHTKANWIVQGMIYAAGTTNFPGVGATNLDSYQGVIRGARGFYFQQGNAKRFASGTYIGVGGATAPIISTGLTTITHVQMHKTRSAYTTATSVAICVPALANGTPGSFYPIAFKAQAAGGIILNTVSATFRWMAEGV